MMKKKVVYQGSSKVLYQSEQDFTLIMGFSDSIKLSNNEVINVSGKGIINNTISSFIMSKLDIIGVENHFLEKINMKEQLIQLVDIIPIQISVSSVAYGRYVKEFGIDEGYVFDNPITEFKLKNSNFKYPIINECQILSLGWSSKEEIEQVKIKANKVYNFLAGLFAGIGIRLVECQLEFGKVFNGEDLICILADEISLDNCRLWDLNNNKKLSFELFETDPFEAIRSYQLVIGRFNVYNQL